MLSCQRRGEVTSGVLFLFWLAASLCGAFTFRSILVQPGFFVDLDHFPHLILLIQVWWYFSRNTKTVLQYPLVITMLFLNFFADAQPKYIDLEGSFIQKCQQWFLELQSKLRIWLQKYLHLSLQRWFSLGELLFLVPSIIHFQHRFFGFAWNGWKRNILTKDLWSLTLVNRWTVIAYSNMYP